MGDAYPALTVEAIGSCAARQVSPDGASLWLVAADLAAGAELRWGAGHGDEAVYVRSGSLAIDGRICPADGAVIVEAGVAVTAIADSDASIVHMGPADPVPPSDGLRGPADTEDELIHVLRGELRVGRRVVGEGDTLWVAADRRYKLYSGDDGVHFINYRRDASAMTSPKYDGPLLEAGESTNMTWANDTR